VSGWFAVLLAVIGVALDSVPAFAQKGVGNREGPTSIGVYVGTFSSGNGEWPRVAIDIDEGLGAFAVRAEAWGVSRPVIVCRGGAPLPACDQRKWIRAISVGGRLVDRNGNWHPYGGFGGGFTWYDNRGSMGYVEAGLRLEVAERIGLDLRGAIELLLEAGELGGGRSLSLGAWHLVGR